MVGVLDVIDFSFADITTQQIVEAGYGGVIRYLSPPPNEKNWTPEQIAEDRAANLWVGFVWETTQTRSLEGGVAGSNDAIRANGMMDDLGVPDTVCIYFANDFSSITFDQVYDYFRDAQSSSKRPIGAYGGQQLLEQLKAYGLITYMWQVSTWNTGQPTKADIVQEANTPCRVPGGDHNTARNVDWGAWPPPTYIPPTTRKVPKTVYIYSETNPDGTTAYWRTDGIFRAPTNDPSAFPDAVHLENVFDLGVAHGELIDVRTLATKS